MPDIGFKFGNLNQHAGKGAGKGGRLVPAGEIDLSSNIGQDVNILFESAGCQDFPGGAHWAYTYLDGLCNQVEEMSPIVNINLPEAFCSNQTPLLDASESLGYTTYGWTVCELNSTNQEVDCVNFSALSHGILGTFNPKVYYENGGKFFECGKRYRVKLTLDNDCTEPVTSSVEFDYRCEEFLPLNYKDIVTCNNTEVNVLIEGDNICPECDYSWAPSIYLDDASIQFPTILGQNNVYAFDSDYHVTAINEVGCVQEEDVKVYTPTFTLEAINKIDMNTMCNYKLHSILSSTEPILLISGLSIDAEFINITTNEMFSATITSSTPSKFEFELQGQSFPLNQTGDLWQIRVQLIFDSDLYVSTPCLLEKNFDIIPGSDLFHGPMLFITPNVFTPNGDGINDTFAPLPWFPPSEAWREYNATWGRLRIWNRWGQLVFEKEAVSGVNEPFGPLDIAWDGTQNGEPAASDVYVFLFSVKNCTYPNGGGSSCHGWCGDESSGINFNLPCDNGSDCTQEYPECWGCNYTGDVTLLR